MIICRFFEVGSRAATRSEGGPGGGKITCAWLHAEGATFNSSPRGGRATMFNVPPDLGYTLWAGQEAMAPLEVTGQERGQCGWPMTRQSSKGGSVSRIQTGTIRKRIRSLGQKHLAEPS